jgi:hypothetical protein
MTRNSTSSARVVGLTYFEVAPQQVGNILLSSGWAGKVCKTRWCTFPSIVVISTRAAPKGGSLTDHAWSARMICGDCLRFLRIFLVVGFLLPGSACWHVVSVSGTRPTSTCTVVLVLVEEHDVVLTTLCYTAQGYNPERLLLFRKEAVEVDIPWCLLQKGTETTLWWVVIVLSCRLVWFISPSWARVCVYFVSWWTDFT